MTIVPASSFRRNMSRYFDLAATERVVISHRDKRTFELVPGETSQYGDAYFADMSNDEYFSNPGVLEHLRQSMEDEKAGRGRIMSFEEVRKELGL